MPLLESSLQDDLDKCRVFKKDNSGSFKKKVHFIEKDVVLNKPKKQPGRRKTSTGLFAAGVDNKKQIAAKSQPKGKRASQTGKGREPALPEKNSEPVGKSRQPVLPEKHSEPVGKSRDSVLQGKHSEPAGKSREPVLPGRHSEPIEKSREFNRQEEVKWSFNSAIEKLGNVTPPGRQTDEVAGAKMGPGGAKKGSKAEDQAGSKNSGTYIKMTKPEKSIRRYSKPFKDAAYESGFKKFDRYLEKSGKPLPSTTIKRIKRVADLEDKKKSEDDISIKFDQIGIPRRRSTLNLYSNRAVIDILSSIREQQNMRQQAIINKELRAIQKRVSKVLENVGMDSDSEEEEDITHVIGGPVKFPNIFDSHAEREKMQERNYIISKVETFEEKAVLRKQYLVELMCWFEDNLNMASDVVTPEEMKTAIVFTQDLHTAISDSLKKFAINGEEVVEKGKMLLQETSKIIEERRAMMTKKTKKERIIVYDDKILLTEPMKWEAATRNIITVFEDCNKMIKNVMFKNALRLGHKQFDYLMVAADKRYQELNEKRKTITELHGKLHGAKGQCDKLVREVEDLKKKLSKANKEHDETKQALEKLGERNKELSGKIIELNAKVRFLEEDLKIANRTPTPPPTPPPPPEPEQVFVKVIDSSTALQLSEVEKELHEAKEVIAKLIADLSAVQDTLKAEREMTAQLQDQVHELENREIPPPPTPVTPSPVAPTQEAPDKDANYFKTLMAGMKKDFITEREKIKALIEREKNRGEAGQRKLEIQHKEHLTIIQKDTIRMLRAIMHFRDHLLSCLQKENLIDQAQQLFDLGTLVKDKMSPDPREVLAMLVSTVVEYLHNMEGIMSNSFLAMKVLMKYQLDKQVENEVQLRMAKEKKEQETKKVIKDCKSKQKEIQGASKDMNKIAKKLKKAKNRLRKFQKSMEGPSHTHDKRYNDLLSRYNHVINLYQNLQSEMENLQSDFHDTMQKKLEEKEALVVSQMKMEIRQQRVMNEEQLKLSIADQRENLKLLTRAYDDNKISRELHAMATAMIQKTLEIPRIKLKNLFEQYITFRTVQDSKKRVETLLEEEDEEDLPAETRVEMQNYLGQLDNKFTSSMDQWRQHMKDLESEKRNLNKKIYHLFNELLLDTGLLMVHPLLRNTNKQTILHRAAATVTRKQMKEMLFKRRANVKNLLCAPEGIKGTSITREDRTDSRWKPPFPLKLIEPPSEPAPEPESELGPQVVAPHMLAYEVNKSRMLAQRQIQAAGRAESFTICDPNYLQFIRDVPYQWTAGDVLLKQQWQWKQTA